MFYLHHSRFISTGVETFIIDEFLPGFKKVHLHGCGDITYESRDLQCLPGSSPRVWRHSYPTGLGNTLGRFISTGVETFVSSAIQKLKPEVHLHGCGDIVSVAPEWVAKKVHLHGCGDITIVEESWYHTDGSSPRVWRHCGYTIPPKRQKRFISTGVETLL